MHEEMQDMFNRAVYDVNANIYCVIGVRCYLPSMQCPELTRRVSRRYYIVQYIAPSLRLSGCLFRFLRDELCLFLSLLVILCQLVVSCSLSETYAHLPEGGISACGYGIRKHVTESC